MTCNKNKPAVIHAMGDHSKELNTTLCNQTFKKFFNFGENEGEINCKKCLVIINREAIRHAKKNPKSKFISVERTDIKALKFGLEVGMFESESEIESDLSYKVRAFVKKYLN